MANVTSDAVIGMVKSWKALFPFADISGARPQRERVGCESVHSLSLSARIPGGAAMSRFSFPLSRRTGFGVALFLVLACVFLGDRVLNGSRGEKYHQQLRGEFRSVDPMPGAMVKSSEDNYSPYNSHKALVEATYTTSAGFFQILQYYDQELKTKGWHRVSERRSLVWGKDLGGREAQYCKGPLAASLFYAGSDRNQAWTFAISLSWGLESCE